MLCVLYVPPKYASEGLVKKVVPVTKVTSDNEQKVTAGVRFVKYHTTPFQFPSSQFAFIAVLVP